MGCFVCNGDLLGEAIFTHKGFRHLFCVEPPVGDSYCPICGREEKVDRGKRLVKCSICLMRGADAVDKELDGCIHLCDWVRTIQNICDGLKWDSAKISKELGISANTLSRIRDGSSDMPKKGVDAIRNTYANFIEMTVVEKSPVSDDLP